MRRIQETLRNHIVFAGFGRSGQKAAEELLAAGIDVGKIVVIDDDPEAIELAKVTGAAAIREDATRDDVQKAVHIERATRMIVSCGRDDTSILTVLTARHLAPGLRIIVAIRNADNEDIAQQAGANIVINPVSFTGLLLASTNYGEHLAEYLTDLATTGGNVRLRERQATDDEVGRSLSDVTGGIAVSLYRGRQVLYPWDVSPPRIEHGDAILEIVPKEQT